MSCSGGCGGKSKADKYARQVAKRTQQKQQTSTTAVDVTAYRDELIKLEQSKRHRRF